MTQQRYPRAIITRNIPAATVTVTRPNNVVAYAAGQVWGPAADARIQLALPAAPADAVPNGLGFIQLGLWIVMTRNNADVINNFDPWLFAAAPTLLGDQATMNLVDADIQNIVWLTAPNNLETSSSVVTAVGLNFGAGIAGRRYISSNNVSGFVGTFGTGIPFGSTVWCYLRLKGAYNPVALEQLFITPIVGYTANASA